MALRASQGVRASTVMLNMNAGQNQSAKKSETIHTYPAVRTILVSSHTRAFVGTAH